MSIYYGSAVADATLTTACDMSTTTGGTETSKTTSVTGGNHFCEIWSQGGSQSSQTSIGSPSGKGWISAAPGAGTFANATWSVSCTFAFSSWQSGNTVTVRFYRLSGGIYNSIGSIVLTITGTSKTTYSGSGTMPSSTFGASDQLYADAWLTDTSGTGGDNPVVYASNSASAGVANDVQVTTSAFTPSAGAVKKDVAFLGKISALVNKDIAWLGKIALGAQKDISWLGKISAPPAQVGVAIANNAVIFAEDSFQLHFKADERQRAQMTVLDYPGTATYTTGERITVDDPTLGRLFSGVLLDDKLDKSNTYPDTTIEHQIDTTGNEYFADKRTSQRFYTAPTYAGSIVVDAVVDALNAEGVVAAYARRIDDTQANWAQGTLSNTVATLNVDNGDLELVNTGGSVTVSYLAQGDWSSGTFSNTQANSGGDLSLIGSTRNWSDGSTSGQTLFGNGSPSQGVTGGQYYLTCSANSETRSRLDFAGNWQNGTIAVDIVLASDIARKSFTWRTTTWNNSDDYAYAIELRTSSIEIRKGTNGAGGATSQLASHTFSPALSAGTYRVQVVANGSNFTVSVNGTQYLSVSDSTYSATGMIALRNRNDTTATTITDYFDNFGVMSALSGTWTSASTSINAVTTIANSSITWSTALSQGGTILVQSSIDGGSTYQTCSNGSVIPGLTNGVSGVGKSVIIKVTLSTTTTATMPDISTLAWNVTGGYVSSGTRISPLLALGNAGRIGSTLITWTANLPSSATTLGIDTSVDGGITWNDVTANNGGPIPGINIQPDPTIDGFDANTSANYISTNGYGGSAATWAYDTANSRVTATNGASAIFAYSSISIANIDIFVDMDTSDAGGVVWSFIDSGNYYGLVVADNQAVIGSKNTLTLYKTSASVQSTLATASISFVRGSYHRIRATTTDGLIVISFDGTQAISYTDSSPLGAGLAGLYQTGGIQTNWATRPFMGAVDLGITGGYTTTARFYQLWLQPLGDNGASKTVLTRCRLATTDPTVTPQVLSMTVAAYGPAIGVGSLIPAADYQMEFISKVFDDVAKKSNYAWWIDQNKALNFRQRSVIPAPWILQSGELGLPVDLEADTNLNISVANDLFRNRQNLTGVIATGSFTNNFQGDGQTTSFTLTNPVAPGATPSITLNSIVQAVGQKGTTGSQFYYAYNDPVIAQDSSLTKLTSSDRLIVSYTGTYITTVTIDNTASQTALAAKEGGTGIVEAVEDVSNNNMTYAAAVAYAQQLLTRYCINGDTIQFATLRNGLQVGQILSVFLPEMGLFDVQVLILTIDITMRTQPGSTVQYLYVVTASELPNPGSWQKLIASSILLT